MKPKEVIVLIAFKYEELENWEQLKGYEGKSKDLPPPIHRIAHFPLDVDKYPNGCLGAFAILRREWAKEFGGVYHWVMPPCESIDDGLTYAF